MALEAEELELEDAVVEEEEAVTCGWYHESSAVVEADCKGGTSESSFKYKIGQVLFFEP